MTKDMHGCTFVSYKLNWHEERVTRSITQGFDIGFYPWFRPLLECLGHLSLGPIYETAFSQKTAPPNKISVHASSCGYTIDSYFRADVGSNTGLQLEHAFRMS